MTVIELVFPGVRLVESIMYFVRLSNMGSNRNIMPSIFSADVYWSNLFSVMPAIFILDEVVGSQRGRDCTEGFGS